MEIHAYIIEENNINCYFFLPSILLLSKKNGNSLSGIQESNGFPCLFHSRPVDSPQKPSQFSFSNSPSIFLFLKDLKSAAQKPSHFSRKR